MKQPKNRNYDDVMPYVISHPAVFAAGSRKMVYEILSMGQNYRINNNQLNDNPFNSELGSMLAD